MEGRDFRSIGRAAQEELRRRALWLIAHEGLSQAEAAKVVGVHRQTVNIWTKRERKLGEDGVVSTARANRVVTNADNTRFLLQGDAAAVREGARDADGTPLPRLAFRGEELLVELDPDRVSSERPVALQRGDDRLTADTMDYDGVERTNPVFEKIRQQDPLARIAVTKPRSGVDQQSLVIRKFK